MRNKSCCQGTSRGRRREVFSLALPPPFASGEHPRGVRREVVPRRPVSTSVDVREEPKTTACPDGTWCPWRLGRRDSLDARLIPRHADVSRPAAGGAPAAALAAGPGVRLLVLHRGRAWHASRAALLHRGRPLVLRGPERGQLSARTARARVLPGAAAGRRASLAHVAVAAGARLAAAVLSHLLAAAQDGRDAWEHRLRFLGRTLRRGHWWQEFVVASNRTTRRRLLPCRRGPLSRHVVGGRCSRLDVGVEVCHLQRLGHRQPRLWGPLQEAVHDVYRLLAGPGNDRRQVGRDHLWKLEPYLRGELVALLPHLRRGRPDHRADLEELVGLGGARHQGPEGVELRHDAAAGPNVHGRVVRGAPKQGLWGPVPPGRHVICVRRAGTDLLGEAEIRELHRVPAHKDVFWLHVAVEVAVPVATVQRLEDLVHDVPHLALLEHLGAPLRVLVEVRVHVLEDHV
mmetsp:Transcript_80363/g.209621  ORF Transcript_80363/g.209621 Transcript_80363/m.209621 type:complete len:458 (+) Transcript_80363:198-1571(+)